jgi:hypothetical protein
MLMLIDKILTHPTGNILFWHNFTMQLLDSDSDLKNDSYLPIYQLLLFFTTILKYVSLSKETNLLDVTT